MTLIQKSVATVTLVGVLLAPLSIRAQPMRPLPEEGHSSVERGPVTTNRDPAKANSLIAQAKSMLDRWDRVPSNDQPLRSAQNLLIKAIAADDQNASLYLQMARCTMLQRYAFPKSSEYDATALAVAKNSAKHALELDPALSDSYVMLADIYQTSGDYPGATEALDAAEKMGSKNPWLSLERALLAIKNKGPADDAVLGFLTEGLNKAKKANDVQALSAANFGIAKFYQAKGEKKKADLYFARAASNPSKS